MKNIEYHFFCTLNEDKYILKVIKDDKWLVNVIKGEDNFVDFVYEYDYKYNIDDVVEFLNDYFDSFCEIDESEKNEFF